MHLQLKSIVVDTIAYIGSMIFSLSLKSVEAPVKFIFPAPPSDTPRPYPFSVLGLGDGEQ